MIQQRTKQIIVRELSLKNTAHSAKNTQFIKKQGRRLNG